MQSYGRDLFGREHQAISLSVLNDRSSCFAVPAGWRLDQGSCLFDVEGTERGPVGPVVYLAQPAGLIVPHNFLE